MGKGRVVKAFILAVALCFAAPLVSCTMSSRSGGAGEEKVVTGGKYLCACGIPKTVKPGEPAPKCCGKTMKKVAD